MQHNGKKSLEQQQNELEQIIEAKKKKEKRHIQRHWKRNIFCEKKKHFL